MAVKCPHCGEPMPEEASFCLACFSSVAADSKSGLSVSKLQKSVGSVLKSKRFIYFIASLVLLVAAVAALSLKTADSGGIANNNKSDADLSEYGVLPSANADLPVFLPAAVQGSQSANQPAESSMPVSETDESVIDYLKRKFGIGNVSVTDSIPQYLPGTSGVYYTDDASAQSGYSQNSGAASQSPSGNSAEFSYYPQNSQPSDTQKSGGTQTEPDKNNAVTVPQTQVINPQTSTTTEVSESAEPEQTAPVYAIEEDMWEYKDYNKSGTQAELTKYNGSSETVVVPAVIDGKKVVSLAKNALSDNTALKTLRFDTENKFSFLWIRSECIENCPNLETIYFPDTDLGVLNNFASGVPNLSSVTFANTQWRALDGYIYYNTGTEWYLRYVCPASKVEVYNIPSWCFGIEGICNIKDNPYIKTVNVHEAVKSLWNSFYSPPNLETINVDARNPYLMSSEGVAYSLTGSSSWLPASNKNKEICVPDGCALYLSTSTYNPYIECIRFPATAKIINPNLMSGHQCVLPALKTVYVENGSPYIDKFRYYCYGDTIIY